MCPASFPPCPCTSTSLASVHGGSGGADGRCNCGSSNRDSCCGSSVAGGTDDGVGETRCGSIGGVLRLANDMWRITHRFDDHAPHSKMQALVKRQPLHTGIPNRNTTWEKRYWMNFVSFNAWTSSEEKEYNHLGRRGNNTALQSCRRKGAWKIFSNMGQPEISLSMHPYHVMYRSHG